MCLLCFKISQLSPSIANIQSLERLSMLSLKSRLNLNFVRFVASLKNQAFASFGLFQNFATCT